eukprot:3402593-Rhodomonas_salina.1
MRATRSRGSRVTGVTGGERGYIFGLGPRSPKERPVLDQLPTGDLDGLVGSFAKSVPDIA